MSLDLNLDPAPWHRAAAAWSALADSLDRAGDELAGGGHDLRTAWAAGGGAARARQRVGADHDAVLEALPPVRRIAAALAEHAPGLAALRRLGCGQLPPTQRSVWAARLRELDATTATALRADRPPPVPTRVVVAGADVLAQRGRSPLAVRAWWRALSPAERACAIRDHPEIVGWLDGVPAADRDLANRAALATQLAMLTEREATLGAFVERLRGGPGLLTPTLLAAQAAHEQVREQLAGLESVMVALSDHGERALLLGFDGSGDGQDGRVIVALGDPDQARHTAVFVPGINSDLRDTSGYVDTMERLRVMAEATTREPHDVSVVYWLGYDAPQTRDALSTSIAGEGGERLTPFVDGLRAAHEPGPSHVTLVGHSYGSTVVAEAALRASTHGGLRVDDIIAVGSPGMHADHAYRLGLDPRHVWGGIAGDDPVGGWLGDLPLVHGEEPTDPAFGANRFVVETHGHSGYGAANSTSLRNQAAIVVGRYDLVSLVHGTPPAA